jgi:hypothetical protein
MNVDETFSGKEVAKVFWAAYVIKKNTQIKQLPKFAQPGHTWLRFNVALQYVES